MPIDAYAACPGGLDKKVKFCCSDLTSELEKLGRMIEGDQRVAALETIQKLEGKFPNRACLFALKSALLAETDREEELKQTVSQFVKAHPQNVVALAESALFTAQERGIGAGIAQLQDALERVGNTIPRQVYDALGAMAVAALQSGRPVSALAHLMLQSTFDPQDEAPLSLIGRVLSSPSVPLLMKDLHALGEAPEGAPWKQAFDEALREAQRGRWRRAAAWLLVIASKHGNPPQIWQTIATLRSWLADHSGAVEALRRVAAMDIAFDEAVEAEAFAQLIDPLESQNVVEVVSIPYQISDIERLTELLLASDRAATIPVDRQMYAEEEIPPRAAYVLLDRAMPRSGAELTLEQVPRVLGTAFLFGKQTDREARVELVTYRTDELGTAEQSLRTIAGDTLGDAGEATVVDRVHPVRHALAANWHLPDDTPQERIRTLSDEFRRQNVYERWPTLPLPVLENKSALDVKGDATYRVKLAALVLLLELSALQESGELDFNQLRSKLDLPLQTALEPAEVDMARLPLVRYPRLNLAKLSDEQLVAVFRAVAGVNVRGVLRRVAEEILRRTDLEAKLDLSGVYRALVMSATNPDDALQHIEEARNWSVRVKKSTAPWDIEELNMRLMRGDGDKASQLIDHLMREHINEPGVRQTLAELLYAAGVIGPDGRPVQPMGGEPVAAPPTAEAGGIWTPDAGTAGEPKSKLWVPGMD